MSVACEVSTRVTNPTPMGIFERYLTIWVGLCILGRHWAWLFVPRGLSSFGPVGSGPSEHSRSRAHLAHDCSHASKS